MATDATGRYRLLVYTNIWWVRLIGLALLIGPFVYYMKNGNVWEAHRHPAALGPVHTRSTFQLQSSWRTRCSTAEGEGDERHAG